MMAAAEFILEQCRLLAVDPVRQPPVKSEVECNALTFPLRSSNGREQWHFEDCKRRRRPASL